MSWFRKSNLEPLTVSMSSIKLGDRLLIVGCSDTATAAALAVKSGLTGRTCLVCPSAEARARAAAEVEAAGALVESFDAPLGALPFGDDTFDVAVIRGVLPGEDAATRAACVAQVRRVLRPGGRCLVIDDAPRGGFAALLRGARQQYPDYKDSGGAAHVLTAAGLKAVRTVASRDGLVFVEGVKPNLEQAEPSSSRAT